MQSENYYKLPLVSNSDLTELKLALRGQEKDVELLRKYYEFGNLVDALITEENKIGFFDYTLKEESSEQLIKFTEDLFIKAVNMKESALSHQLLNLLLRNMEFQKVKTVQEFPIEYEFNKVFLPAKCKFDGLNEKINTGLDLKSTVARTLKSFIASIEHFDYDRQSAWYMDLAGIDRHWIVGISKERFRGAHKVYPFAIKRGDETYKRGRAKYEFLAYQFHNLIYKFQHALNNGL